VKTIHRIIISAVVVLASWTIAPPPAEAQSSSTSASTSTSAKGEASAVASDTLTVADVQRAAEQLAIAVREAVKKTTEDPAVKVAALKVAKNAVVAAQVVVTQQMDTLQTVLDALAKEIAQATEKQQSKSGNH
jgi:hypothetical protein